MLLSSNQFELYACLPSYLISHCCSYLYIFIYFLNVFFLHILPINDLFYATFFYFYTWSTYLNSLDS